METPDSEHGTVCFKQFGAERVNKMYDLNILPYIKLLSFSRLFKMAFHPCSSRFIGITTDCLVSGLNGRVVPVTYPPGNAVVWKRRGTETPWHGNAVVLLKQMLKAAFITLKNKNISLGLWKERFIWEALFRFEHRVDFKTKQHRNYTSRLNLYRQLNSILSYLI